MSVHFVKRKSSKSGKAKPAEDAFAKWYAANREAFNESRRNRYKSDPAYKERVLATARSARDARRKPNEKPDDYTVNHALAAEILGVTIWTLRNWRAKGYFPEPKQFSDGAWFKDHQLALLGEIQHYMDVNQIKRLSAEQRAELKVITDRIWANWE
jgi:hypothetical protein